MELKDLIQKFDVAVENLNKTLETQEGEIKAHGETTAATAKTIAGLETQLKEIGAELKVAQKRIDEWEVNGQRPGLGGAEPPKTIGELFVTSEEYQDMLKRKAKTSQPVEVGSFFSGRKTTLTSGDASAGALVMPQRLPQIVAPPDRELWLRDMLSVQGTTSNSVEYVEETGFTNAAAPTAETVAKPESALSFVLRSTPVKTIAHWIPAARQILDDAPQLRGYIDNRLTFGLKLVEETQILYGDGAAPNLQGILTHASRQTYNWSAGQVGDTRIDAIRRAITLARIAEYPVTGVVLHPTDWEHIQLQKGSDGHYIWIRVTDGGPPRLWAVPVLDTTAVTEGEAALGAWGLGAQLWDREQSQVRVAEQHGNFFIQNMVAILAEERMALAIYRPEAFVHVTFDQAPVAGS